MALTKVDDRGLNTPIDLLDNENIRLGTSQDLKIFHGGGHSDIHDTGTGNLRLRGSTVQILNEGATEQLASFTSDGAVELYYDASKKLETFSGGIQVQGSVFVQDGSSSGNRFTIGSSGDLKMFHDGTDSIINNGTGIFRVRGDHLLLSKQDNSRYLQGNGGVVELFHNNNKKLETTSTGVSVTGGLTTSAASTFNEDVTFTGDNANILFDKNDDNIRVFDNASIDFGQSGDLKIHHSGHVNIIDDVQSKNISIQRAGIEQWKFGDGTFIGPDNKKIQLGNALDLQIYHDGTNSTITNTTGDLYITDSGGNIYIQSKVGEQSIVAFADGAVDLYHNNSKKLETTTYGTRTTGYHTVSSNAGFQGDAADWTSSTPYMHNLALMWDSGHFVNSTGVFTCPVAGKYICSASVQAHRSNNTSGASGQYYNVIWQKNGSNYHSEVVGTLATDGTNIGVSDVNAKHETVTATVIIECAANDTIRAHSNHGYRHNTQNLCSVYLLG